MVTVPMVQPNLAIWSFLFLMEEVLAGLSLCLLQVQIELLHVDTRQVYSSLVPFCASFLFFGADATQADLGLTADTEPVYLGHGHKLRTLMGVLPQVVSVEVGWSYSMLLHLLTDPTVRIRSRSLLLVGTSWLGCMASVSSSTRTYSLIPHLLELDLVKMVITLIL